MKNGRYSNKDEPGSILRKVERVVRKRDLKATPIKKGYSHKLPSIKKETNTELGALDEYIFNKQSPEKPEPRIGNRIFKEIELNAKVYEKEIVKYLGFELPEESTKIPTNKEMRSKSMLDIQDYDKNSMLWQSQLKKLDQQEKMILKSLQQLDVTRKVPKLLKPIKTIKNLGSKTRSSILIRKTKK